MLESLVVEVKTVTLVHQLQLTDEDKHQLKLTDEETDEQKLSEKNKENAKNKNKENNIV